jgi:DNA-binding winged helix-turn-helix (wHTH) protein
MPGSERESSARPSVGTPAREQRGFALYVGLSESKARESGIELGEMVDALKRELLTRIPQAESHALAVVAPLGTTERDLDLVLRATIERPPAERAALAAPPDRIRRPGVVIDLARHRVLVDDRDVGLTFKEFALLQVLVRNDGRTLARDELRGAIALDDENEVHDRTIDVHIRRLRMKFGDYPDVIRTVHSKGYRFDPRSDVTVLRISTPSPDLF